MTPNEAESLLGRSRRGWRAFLKVGLPCQSEGAQGLAGLSSATCPHTSSTV